MSSTSVVTSSMSSWPAGTVTFLFTDIEGSTGIWERDEPAMWAALARHNGIVRAAVEASTGVAFKTIGDAFQAAFHRPDDAIAAAVAAQRALQATAWGAVGPLRVRMAIHCGSAAPADGDYLAPCLNRLARLLSTAWGSQILATNAVASAVRGNLPSGIELHPLGRHRLRDLLEPEEVVQVVAEGLLDHFPPLKSLDRFQTNLPVQPTVLIGREAELARIEAAFDGGARLVTLTGPGGSGKTRLALQAGATLNPRFDDGVFVVHLAPVADPDLVVPAIAQVLGVRESAGLALDDRLSEFLTSRRVLLILDNFEQIIGAGTRIAGLLARAGGLAVLVTSRLPLRIGGEHQVSVPPLAVPDPDHLPALDTLGQVPSVALFVERAAAVRPDFALDDGNAGAISAIARRLDGLPLAIELAAARTKMLSPDEIRVRLGRRLDLLKGGRRDALPRHQTLRSTIAWSYDLLNEEQRVLFRHLAMFPGGSTLAAVEATASARAIEIDLHDAMESLLEHSLLGRIQATDGTSRFVMLETIREYAMERLTEAGEAAAAARAQANHFVGLASRADEGIGTADQERWLNTLDDEHDNARAALTWLEDASEPDAAETRLRLAGSLARFWQVRGHLTEGRRHLEGALERDGRSAPHVRAAALEGAGTIALMQGDYGEARQWYEQGFALARFLGDEDLVASFLNSLAAIALAQGDLTRATDLCQESLEIARSAGASRGIGNALANLGAIAHYRGELESAHRNYESCLALRRQLGDELGAATMLLNLLLLLAPNPEDADEAARYGEECLRITTRLGDKQGMAYACTGLGVAAETGGDAAEAAMRYAESLELFRTIGDRSGIAGALGKLALATLGLDDPTEGARLCCESLTIFVELGDQDGIAFGLEAAALVAAAWDGERAGWLLGSAGALRHAIEIPVLPELRWRIDALADALTVALGADGYDAALRSGQALALDAAVRVALQILRSIGGDGGPLGARDDRKPAGR